MRFFEAVVQNGPGSSYKLHEDERQWPEGAVAEGTATRESVFECGLPPGGDSWPTVIPSPLTAPALD